VSKIFEALQLREMDTPIEAARPAQTLTVAPRRAASKDFEERLLTLHRRIDALVDSEGAKVVSIVSMQSVEESFTYTYEMARIAATRFRLRVLILCTLGSGSCKHLLNGAPLQRGWEQAAFEDKPLADAIHTVENPSISVSQLNASQESLSQLAATTRFESLMARIRKRYDLILIDSRPFSSGMDAALLSPIADGTILIVDAGASRWQVVRNAVDQVVSQRGTLLGVVLNKRRHFIPNFIYRRL
jgi:Mrp family chromosome partitioning ATPase